jgi:beta-mannosidase
MDGTGVRSDIFLPRIYFVDVYLAGPMLMTVGPWRPINLHIYDTKILDIDVRSMVSESLDVNITVDFTLSALTPGAASITLRDRNGVYVAEGSNIKADSGHFRSEFSFSAGSLELWYPVGYGKQPMYTVGVKFNDEVHENNKHGGCD